MEQRTSFALYISTFKPISWTQEKKHLTESLGCATAAKHYGFCHERKEPFRRNHSKRLLLFRLTFENL
jgi:hypothetical protein